MRILFYALMIYFEYGLQIRLKIWKWSELIQITYRYKAVSSIIYLVRICFYIKPIIFRIMMKFAAF